MSYSSRTAMTLAVTLPAVTGLVAPALGATVTFTPVADAFVNRNQPNDNKGSSTVLRLRGDAKRSYLRFNVAGLPSGESVTKATLRVFATSGPMCAQGAQVLRAANDTWGESTITWNNQPGPTGPVLGSAPSWSSQSYVSFDVTAAVGGPGLVSFVLRHVPGCSVSADATFHSREGPNDPQLVVETAAVGAPQCSDEVDNDGDGKIDFPADPGCTSASDNDETDPPSGGLVVAAAGDIVCDPSHSNFGGGSSGSCQHRATDNLLTDADAVLTVGDLQYENGTLAKFNTAYDPTWGQLAAKTFPSPGNHEYKDPAGGAAGYFSYWASKGRPTGGATNGYYSFDLDSWHLISLNSSRGSTDACQEGPSCAEGSPQNNFLEQDLAATTEPCIAAYWHHPLFNSGTSHGNDNTSATRALWDDLYAAGADIILNAHEHNYQRYAKQTPTGQAAANGIREFVVGTGGRSHNGLLSAKDPNFQFGNTTAFGVLELSLDSGAYSWRFVSTSGAVLDSGGPVACN